MYSLQVAAWLMSVGAPADAGRGSAAPPVPYALSLSPEAREQLTNQKRDEVIEQLERISQRFEDDAPQKPEMLFQLSEYYWEKSKYLFRSEEARYDKAYQAYEARKAHGGKGQKPVLDHAPSELFRMRALAIYERLLKSFPRYEREDEVLFALAYNLYELGKNDEAVARYDELIRRFPRSAFVPDAYLQLGNHYFEHNDLQRAIANYQKALATKVPKIHSYALYKLAWCDFNLGAFDKAEKKLEEVVDFAESRKEMVDLRHEALNDLVVVFVHQDKAQEGMAYFLGKTTGERREKLISRLASALLEAGHHKPAIGVLRYLLEHSPSSPDAPDWQKSVVLAYEGLRQREKVDVEVRRLAELYRPGSAWWIQHRENPGALRSAFDESEEVMRTLATEYHQEAQKTRQVETYRLARDLYRQYLQAFASSNDEQWVSDYAFNMSFYEAEILWTLEEWEAAARAYDRVVGLKIPDRHSAREVSNESYRKSAAYSAILAYEKMVKLERGEISDGKPQEGQKVSESAGKGKVDAKLGPKGKASPEEPLTATERALVAACDRMVARFPGDKEEIDIRYRAAIVLYEKGHHVEAAERFSHIILKWPDEKRSEQAADLTLAVLEQKQEWGELNQVARRLEANKRLCKPNSDLAQRVHHVVEGSAYRYVDETLYRKEHKKTEAALAFISFANEFPRSERAEGALTFAVLIYDELGEVDLGIQVGERMLREYPHSALLLKVRYTLARLYERILDYRRSAEMYEAFVSAYEQLEKALQAKAPRGETDKRPELVHEASAWLADARYDAGLWWEAVGRTDRAITAYKQYLAHDKGRPDVPEVAFHLGELYERDRRWREAASAFHSFQAAYAEDPRAKASMGYLALYHRFLAATALHETGEAQALAAELSRGHARLPAAARQEGAVQQAYAHARFQLLEPVWKSYGQIQLNRLSSLRADLISKQRRLKDVEKGYLDVLEAGAGEYGIASLTRIGLAYADLARDIRGSPSPRGLSSEEQQLYRSELERLAQPLQAKATEVLEKGLAKAFELGLYTRWTLEAEEQLERYRPGAYPKPLAPSYELSESDVFVPLEEEL
jgi:tetratricopeptide (TPR) repeat protein